MPISDIGLEAEFTFERDPSGAIDEPAFRILMLGDWSGDGEARPLSERRPVEIDRDNFDEVVARMKASAELDFEDGSSLTLDFGSIDDFHPDEIFRRVPVFAELRDLRKRLQGSDTFNAAARDARNMFGIGVEAPSAPETVAEGEPADNLLDAILSQPSGGAAAPKRGASGELGNLVKELVRPHLVSLDEEEQATLVSSVDLATGQLMRRILHHRRFQELEAAWRGLFLLVRRADTSTDLKIFVLDVSKEELAEDLKSAESLTETALYKFLVRDAIETPGGEPWAFVGANHAYSPVVDDVAALMRISKICATADAPFVAHMRSDVLGVHSLHDHADAADWNIGADTDAGKLWFALRGQPGAEHIGMTIPRFISRLPYGAETDPLETFAFEEFGDGEPAHDDYCWVNASFISALLHAQSYSEYGWDGMGNRLFQDVDGLPVHVRKSRGETLHTPCAEIQMTDRGVEKLMDFGLTPLVSYRAMDRVKIARHQSIADPPTALRGRWNG
jgi:type VI secretion system protein ImpC